MRTSQVQYVCMQTPYKNFFFTFILFPTLSTKETVMQTQLLTTKEASKILGISTAFLERDRWAGAKIPFIKVGSRAVRYRQSDLDNYINKRVAHSTSESVG